MTELGELFCADWEPSTITTAGWSFWLHRQGLFPGIHCRGHGHV